MGIRPELSHYDRRPVATTGYYIGWDNEYDYDDDESQCNAMLTLISSTTTGFL